MAMRFMGGLASIITQLGDPKQLKITVETLGFQHLDLEVTVPRVVIFRDAIMDLLASELGARMTPKAKEGFATFLNYVGGSYIYVRITYAERLKLIVASWNVATKQQSDELEHEEGEEKEGDQTSDAALSGEAHVDAAKKTTSKKTADAKSSSWFGAKKKSATDGTEDGAAEKGHEKDSSGGTDFRNTNVPTTFNEMFMFNSAVMGFGKKYWMSEILESFDAIVVNVANSYRLQEECDVLSLRLAKVKTSGQINLGEYKAVMLASLRSLVKDWGSNHEVSWSWLWENVERMIKAIMGKPEKQEKALSIFFDSLDENALGNPRDKKRPSQFF